MSKLMSVALTEQAVTERRKTVTRRLGWWEDKNGRRLLNVGDELTLCRKVMGRRKGEPLVKLAQVRVIDIRREAINAIEDEDVFLEGFTWDDLADWDGVAHQCLCGPSASYPEHPWGDLECEGRLGTAFLQFFLANMKCPSGTVVTRIEWKYLP